MPVAVAAFFLALALFFDDRDMDKRLRVVASRNVERRDPSLDLEPARDLLEWRSTTASL